MRDDALVADANHDRWVQRLTTAARSGEILNLTQRVSDPDLLDPAQADTWPENRRVPAAAIRTTLLNAKLNHDPHGLRLRGAHIIGALDLEHVRVPCPLWLTHCRIEESADLTKGRLVELNLAHTHSRNLVLDGAQITGGTVLTGLKATGEVRALGAHLGGQLNLTNAEQVEGDLNSADDNGRDHRRQKVHKRDNIPPAGARGELAAPRKGYRAEPVGPWSPARR